eukprot:9505494-Lingulodinium_polyedra.AAC.1
MGPDIAVVVQLCMRRRSNKTLGVTKWNYMQHVPFKFHQLFSCKTGNAVPGCHLACFVGASRAITLDPCAEIP